MSRLICSGSAFSGRNERSPACPQPQRISSPSTSGRQPSSLPRPSSRWLCRSPFRSACTAREPWSCTRRPLRLGSRRHRPRSTTRQHCAPPTAAEQERTALFLVLVLVLVLVLELALEHLAGLVARQLVVDDDLARHLVVGELALHV